MEALLFEPDISTQYRTIAEPDVSSGWFNRKTAPQERQVPDGEKPNMVTNPLTGQQEPGIKVAYQFDSNGNSTGYILKGYPDYLIQGGRMGNMLFVEATLPKSVADKLRQAVSDNPRLAREFARTLVLNNGMPEEVWNRVVRPPFDKLPNDWELAVADLRQDTQFGDVRHNVLSRQIVRLGQ